MDNYKNFDAELGIINFIDNINQAEISITKEDLFSTIGIISKVGKELIVEVNNNDLESLNDNERFNEIESKIDKNDYVLDSFTIDSNSTDISDKGGFFKTICSANELRNKRFNKDSNSIYKCFIKTDLKKLELFHYQFETVAYQKEMKKFYRDCLRIEFENGEFDIIQVKLDDVSYFIIENKEELSFVKFENSCFAIRQALGFISGYMPGGEEYFFDNNLNYYYVSNHRAALDSMYYPLNSNPHNKLHYKPDDAERFKDQLNVISLAVFSNLISKIYNNRELSASIILLLEASSVRSLLLIPSVFSVIIEALSRIISEDETGQFVPVGNPELANEIIEQLNDVIDEKSDEIGSDTGVLKLKRRINEVNRPINRGHLTNNEKLTLPFEQLGIRLTMDDIKAIEHRNDFLHGNILLLNDNVQTESELNNYMLYVSSKLYTLISALILKYAGYSGYIINYPKFNEDMCNIETTEDYYRFI